MQDSVSEILKKFLWTTFKNLYCNSCIKFKNNEKLLNLEAITRKIHGKFHDFSIGFLGVSKSVEIHEGGMSEIIHRLFCEGI